MAKRRRQKMAQTATQSKTANEVPLEAVRDAQASYPEVALKVCRQNARGHWQTVVTNVQKPTSELADLEPWLMELAGGGRFRIQSFNPLDKTHEVVPAFYVTIEGAPHAATVSTNDAMAWGTPGAPGSPAGYPQAANQASPWARGLAPHQQQVYVDSMDPNYRPGMRYSRQVARHTADEIAVKQMATLEAELKSEREKRERDRKEFEQRMLQMEKDARQREERFREEQARAREQAFEERIKLLTAQPQQPNIVETIAPLATALAPVFAAMVSGSKDRAAIAADQQAKTMELQMQGINTLLAAGQNKVDPMDKLMTTFGPIIVPLVQKMMENNSPEMKAKLFEAMADQQLASVSMVAQMMQQQIEAEGQQPPWAPLASALLQSAVELGSAYIQDQRAEKDAQARKQVAGGAQPKQVAADAAQAQEVDPAYAEAIKTVEKIFSTEGFPEDFKTREWANLLMLLHAEHDQEETARLLAEHIAHLARFNTLPEVLKDVAQDPEATLKRILALLPINIQAPEYAKAVVERTCLILRGEDEEEDHGEEEGEDNDDVEEAQVVNVATFQSTEQADLSNADMDEQDGLADGFAPAGAQG
jgi:hypothetical protein